MKVNELDEGAIRDIGHAFGYYDYGGEQGLAAFFPSQEATSLYIQGYVRGMLRASFSTAPARGTRASSPTSCPGRRSAGGP